jgi:hypothetical protein
VHSANAKVEHFPFELMCVYFQVECLLLGVVTAASARGVGYFSGGLLFNVHMVVRFLRDAFTCSNDL